MVNWCVDQKLRLRNIDARHGRIETGAVVKNRQGMSGVDGGKGTCYQWKKSQCSKGDLCSFRHESDDRAPKPTLIVMRTKRSVSKKRSIQGKSNHGSILRQPCRYYLKGTCTRSPCEYWPPPECQFHKTETGCKAGDKCLFPHQKIGEQPEERLLFPQKKRKRRQECCGCCEIVPQLGCVSQDSEALVSQKRKTVLEKPDAKSLGIDSKSTIHLVYAASSKYPGKERTIARKNLVKNSHQRSPQAMKFEDSSQEEIERQERCGRSKTWNLAKNIYKLKKNDTATFNKRAGGKRVCSGFRSEHAHGQPARPQLG